MDIYKKIKGLLREEKNKMNIAFCTTVSKLRVYQGIVLQRSLNHNCKNFTLYILCVDDEAYEICSKVKLEKTILLKVQEIENEALLQVKKDRALNEYCWTLKPFLIDFIMKQNLPFDFITYVDADMCFFSDPTPIFELQRKYNVLISEHDYIDSYRGVEDLCGKYNSGFISFKNTDSAIDPLRWWQERCLEWCYDNAVEGKFGDQKYLDQMVRIFPEVQSITTHGVNIAPWNESKYHFDTSNEKVYVNGNKLICYHFSGFRIVAKDKAALLIGSKKLYDIIHFPYMNVLKGVIEDIEKIVPGFRGFSIEEKFRKDAKYFNL